MKLNDTQLVFCPPPHNAQPEVEKPRETEQAADGTTDKPSRRAAARRKKTRDGASQQPTKRARAQSKQDRVIEMLKRRPGATIAAIMKATGWQPHSVRGFFAGVVRSKLGLTLVSEKTSEQRVYRIVAKAAAPKRKGKAARTTA